MAVTTALREARSAEVKKESKEKTVQNVRTPEQKEVSREKSDKWCILGLHCHAMKNKNANHSIQKDYNLGNEKR